MHPLDAKKLAELTKEISTFPHMTYLSSYRNDEADEYDRHIVTVGTRDEGPHYEDMVATFYEDNGEPAELNAAAFVFFVKHAHAINRMVQIGMEHEKAYQADKKARIERAVAIASEGLRAAVSAVI